MHLFFLLNTNTFIVGGPGIVFSLFTKFWVLPVRGGGPFMPSIINKNCPISY